MYIQTEEEKENEKTENWVDERDISFFTNHFGGLWQFINSNEHKLTSSESTSLQRQRALAHQQRARVHQALPKSVPYFVNGVLGDTKDS